MLTLGHPFLFIKEVFYEKVHEKVRNMDFRHRSFRRQSSHRWMPDYTYTFFNDFAFKGSGIDPASITKMLAYVFGFAGIVGAVCELVIGYLVDRTRTKWGKIRPWIGFGVVPMAIVAMLVFIAPKTGNYKLAVAWMFIIYSLYTAAACAVESPRRVLRCVLYTEPRGARRRNLNSKYI